jgi:ATP-dependent Lon protease
LAGKVLEAYKRANLSVPRHVLGQRPYTNPGKLADMLAPHLLSIGIDRRQELLATGDVIARLEKTLELMKTDQQAAELV